MREVNFSIPNANKASVGITTALYDRRALDCTSTLPLINSLNNLAYLTTSSGRIRDILTVDGGIERLVCILKEGRSKDPMEMWKWNLAFQCIVNVGVRGSEAVRTRVVEADMVPVIATILDNYFQVIEKSRESERRKCPYSSSRGFSRSSGRTDSSEHRSSRSSRRPAPPPISIPEVLDQAEGDEQPGTVTPTASTANLSLSSPPERTTFARQHHRSHTGRAIDSSFGLGSRPLAPPLTSVPSQSNSIIDDIRPVREADRLPSMLSAHHAEGSLPQSPTTPGGPAPRADAQHVLTTSPRQRRRPSIRQQLSMSGSEDDGQIEDNTLGGSITVDSVREPLVGIQADIVMEDIPDDDSLLQPQDAAVTINVTDITGTDDDAFNIAHGSGNDVSIVNPAATPTQDRMIIPALRLPDTTAAPPAPNFQQQLMWSTRALQTERMLATGVKFIPAALPRDEDVLMSLQLLAYVSKYCNLRTYFQKSHLVPRLKISESDLCQLLDGNPSFESSGPTQEELDEEWDNEFVEKPDQEPYNIFPLIEKFTAKHGPSVRHTQPAAMLPQQGDMQYWAGVVMRNLCRKDDSRGGIRQCAYWKCGKWEEFTRQFAKCRRCRRTKYCSKDCQKGAWGSHRFWCVAADDATSSSHGHSHSRVESAEAGSSSGGDRLQVPPPPPRQHRSLHGHHHHSHH